MDHCASGKTQGFKCANCLSILQIQQNVKINYWGMKVIGTKSLASQLLSPPLTAGKIQSSRLQSSSPSSTALASQLLIFKGGPPARARRTTFWALEVKPRPNLSDLYGISGSYPQIVHPPCSTTALASFSDDFRSGGLVILGIALVTATSWGTSSKC